MKRRSITTQQLDETFIYHELSHYVLCEISRRIEPNFTKTTKIKLSNTGNFAQIEMACCPNIPKDISDDTEIGKLKKDFFLETKERVFLKTLQLACGYLTSTIFVFSDDPDHFFRLGSHTKDSNGEILFNFYNLYEGTESHIIPTDFELIYVYWNDYLGINLNKNKSIWEIIIKYTKNVLEFSPIKNLMICCFKFSLTLKEDPSFIIENDCLLKLEEHANNLICDDTIEFYKKNLADFINEIEQINNMQINF